MSTSLLRTASRSLVVIMASGLLFAACNKEKPTIARITVVDEDTFTVNNVQCLTSPGSVTTDHVSPVVYNQGTTNPSTTNKRDRLRAIIHMILASPDFTIQR